MGGVQNFKKITFCTLRFGTELSSTVPSMCAYVARRMHLTSTSRCALLRHTSLVYMYLLERRNMFQSNLNRRPGNNRKSTIRFGSNVADYSHCTENNLFNHIALRTPKPHLLKKFAIQFAQNKTFPHSVLHSPRHPANATIAWLIAWLIAQSSHSNH